MTRPDRAEPIRPMLAGSVMVPTEQFVAADQPISEAVVRMQEAGTDFLPVIDADEIVATVTLAELRASRLAEAVEGRTRSVQDHMNPAIVYCYQDDDLATAKAVMEKAKARHLLVVDRDRRLVGSLRLETVESLIEAGAVSGSVDEQARAEKAERQEHHGGGRLIRDEYGRIGPLSARPRLRRE